MPFLAVLIGLTLFITQYLQLLFGAISAMSLNNVVVCAFTSFLGGLQGSDIILVPSDRLTCPDCAEPIVGTIKVFNGGVVQLMCFRRLAHYQM